MVSLPDKVKVPASFAADFVCTDQDVKDLEVPRPETRWCLLELPQKDLDALAAGNTYYFQSQGEGEGLNDGGAAIATLDQTFSIEFLENSNSLFIAHVFEGSAAKANESRSQAAVEAEANLDPEAKNSGFRCEVFGQVRGHLLTKPAPVNKQRIIDLVAANPLGDPVDEDNPPLSVQDLSYRVAASPAQLQAILDEGPCVEIDGKLRYLPPNVEAEIMDTVVNVVKARGWNPQEVSIDDLFAAVVDQLGGNIVPSVAVLKKAVRCLLGTPPPREEGSTPDKEALAAAAKRLCLDKAKMTKFQAVQLLRQPPEQVRQRFNLSAKPPPQPPLAKRARLGAVSGKRGLLLEDFRTALQELTGATEPPTDEEIWATIGDEACLDEFERTLHLIDVATLPLDPQDRLKKLFSIQTHWNPGRLEAWVAPTLGAGIKVAPWLLKQTRAVFVEITEGKEERFLTKKFAM
mmetsp:Transcript_18562/g.39953  ORF Transcript_18562/g.39953 Transcript_18562/m.39953 type:complete len:461 (-) Transcript_18562:203-1585(-)